MTTEEMIDRMVTDIAENMTGRDLQAFIEYYVRQDLEDQTPEDIKEQYSDMYDD